MRHIIFVTILALSLTSFTAASAASGAGAINQQFNTSTRFEAMGGAGVAVPWGWDTNHWANPSQLAFRRGVSYTYFESFLAAGLADDIKLTNEEMTFGALGVTLLWAKDPFEGNFLDMGLQEARDEWGNPTAVFRSYMQTTTWGLGVDLVQVADRFWGDGNMEWSRRFSVALGASWSDFEDRLAPDFMIMEPGLGTGQASTSSRGLLVRATLLERELGPAPAGGSRLGVKLDVAFGAALLHDTDEFLVHIDSDQGDPMPRTYSQGYAIHLEFPFGRDMRPAAGGGFSRVLVEGLDPLLSFTYSRQTLTPGYSWDVDADEYVYEREDDDDRQERGWGYELGLANVFFLRHGYLKIVAGDVQDITSGWGLQLPLGRFGGLRYDEATVPQASDLPTVDRKSWSVWADPLALVQALRD